MHKSTSEIPKLTEGPIGNILFRLTIPMFFGIVGTIAFNLIDAYFIGQLGIRELAAISFTFPVIFIFGGISFGLGIGASAVISKAIGENDHNKVARLTTDSLVLALLVVSIFIVLGFLTIDPVFKILGADSETLPLIRDYMKIWYPGMIFLVIPIVGNNAIRATGDAKSAGMLMVVGVLVNTILDPLFIFGYGPFPRLEMQGAALATVIARALTLVVSLWILSHKYNMIILTTPKLKQVLESWKKILFIGLPTAGTNLMRPLAAGIIIRIVASYGAPAVAAFGVATRIDLFAMTVVMALTSILGPFIGQNLGAQKPERVREGINKGHIFSVIWGIIALLVLGFTGRFIAPLFNSDPEVIETIIQYLWIVPVGYGLYGVFTISNAALNVLNKPYHAAVINIVMLFGLLIPFVLIGSNLYGLIGLFIAIPLANILSGIGARLALVKILDSLTAKTQSTAKIARNY
jgi:putative MATE family efflux protein